MSGAHFDFEEESTLQHFVVNFLQQHSFHRTVGHLLSEGKLPVASLAGGGEGSGRPGGGRHVGLLHVEVQLNALMANHLEIILHKKVC